ncbi:hypothetical protein [Sphingobacterium arenae]|uniref:Uncharacterized protein n=1 Tax=Sphingobacterium arenae TaxID=1280598 RepID=A0ABR7Y6U4_9SPHI|nr:hypothetical protein [Sphingobacterium arenae]MBD1427039.1 hypothetical protein [Sphingobacterium arenae]
MANSIIKYAKGVVTLFAVCVIGTASAAPNGNGDEKEAKKEVKEITTLQSSFLVNKESAFEPRETANPSLNCDTEDTRHCVYELTSEGMSNIPEQSSYTPAEIDQFLADGWIEPHPDSDLAIYQN